MNLEKSNPTGKKLFPKYFACFQVNICFQHNNRISKRRFGSLRNEFYIFSRVFTNLRNFNVHLTKLHRNLEDDIASGTVFRCSKCPDRIYRSNFALGRHYREYHNSRMPKAGFKRMF